MAQPGECLERRKFIGAIAVAMTCLYSAPALCRPARESVLKGLAGDLGFEPIALPLWAKLKAELGEFELGRLLSEQEARMRLRIPGRESRQVFTLASAEDYWSGRVINIKGLHFSEIEIALIGVAAGERIDGASV